MLRLLRQHGWNASSFQVLERGFSYWFEGDACVAYVDTGQAWVAAGAPIAAEKDLERVALRFAEVAAEKKRRVCFFAVEERAVTSRALASMPIGEQPVWDPRNWKGGRRVREQVRRAEAKGVRGRALTSTDFEAMRARVESLVSRWLASRKMPPMGFVVDVQPFDFAAERRCFVAERDGVIVGLLVAVPVYQRIGWLFEDLLRTPDAPNGTTELLVDLAMRSVGEEGSRYATLGLAPLAGDVNPWFRFARAASAALYDFDGVRRFKAKFHPDSWDSIHLAWPRDRSSNVAVYDALKAFTVRRRDGRDRASFIRFGLETLAHAPMFGVRILAVLLVPWTIALALAPTARYFPSRHVQLAWVTWDIVLGVAMLVLASRWRPLLARSLALATLFDAALTIFEVVTDAAPRSRTWVDFTLLALSCVGPLLATSQLWGAMAWRKKLAA